MKRKITACLIIGMMLCVTGCSGGPSGAEDNSVHSSPNYNYEGAESYEKPDAVGGGAESKEPDGSGDDQQAQHALDMEMLVYTCDMSIDVLEFDQAVADFRSLLETYGGFVANESYSDDQGNVNYYRKDQQVWHNYVATVRVPSKNYKAFTEGVAGIGDLRNRTAKVENVSTEYRDAKTTLAIYEAKQERYLNLLKTITDEAYAIEVESELTDIEIEIAKLKTRMSDIETDVAYSYVNVKLHEVREYTAEPVQTDTFAQRLKSVANKSWANFLSFAEKCLFVLIYMLPYIIIAAVIAVIVLAILNKKYKIFRKKKRQEGREHESERGV